MSESVEMYEDNSRFTRKVSVNAGVGGQPFLSANITLRPLFLITFLILAGIVLFSREFPGPDGPPSPIFSRFAFGFRWIDIAISTISYCVFITYSASTRKLNPWGNIGQYIKSPLILFLIAILVSLIYGFMQGGTELFFEWRSIMLGLLIGSSFRALIRPKDLYITALAIFFIISVHSLVLLIKWMWYGGFPPYNGPTFDGPTLSNGVAAVSLGISFLLCNPQNNKARKCIYIILIVSNAILVMLAFRRTYWAELMIALVVFYVLYKQTRFWVGMTVITGSLVLILTFSLERIRARVESIVKFSDTSNPYTTTNLGHLNDVMDAIIQIQNSPILGIGLGTTYETYYTLWKTESWGVHNGPLHVWLRFGLLGLISYLWFHWRITQFLWRHRHLSLSKALLSYWIAIFVPPLFFSPWPYGALQNTLLLSILFALMDAEVSYWHHLRRKQ